MEKFGAIMVILLTTLLVIWYGNFQWNAPWHLLALSLLTGPTYFFWRKWGSIPGVIIYFSLLGFTDWNLVGWHILLGFIVLMVAIFMAERVRRIVHRNKTT